MHKWIIILIVVVIIIFYNNNIELFTEELNFYIPDNNVNYKINPNTIFVSIASYRDDECPLTIKEIYEKAQYPENIYVGICQQNSSKDLDCYVLDNSNYSKNIKKYKLHSKYARGPTYARFLCSTLWRGEEYFLQIDSHTKFMKHWDTDLIKMLQQCPSDKAVLSYYPLDYNQLKYKDTHVPFMCKCKFNKDNMISFEAALIKQSKELKQIPFLAGGMFFTRGNFLKEVPYDPYLPYLFQGEEILLSSRLWTAGYDFYCPNKNICIHHYGRKDKPKFWGEHKSWKKTELKSLMRAKVILQWNPINDLEKGFRINLEKYGLGGKRTIGDYYKFIGIDFKNKKGSDNCTKTYINNQWV